MKNTYWNHNGKYQWWANKINETMPDMYKTDNKYMNVFLAISKLYYDIYNNGGCNILSGCYTENLKLVHGFIGRFNTRTAIKDKDYLEERINTCFEKLMAKDLSFVNHGFWINGKENKISMTEQKSENWRYITCGAKENVEYEFEHRKNLGWIVV